MVWCGVENRGVSESLIDVGSVTAPSGLLVFGMAGWMDYWPQTGRGLFERAVSTVAGGGGHLRDGLCEAVVVRAAADRPLRVRASTSPSPFDGEPTIAVLEVELGVSWPVGHGAEKLVLGDLPVDRCGMVLGDGRALDGFVGLGGVSTDGLADLAYWGKHAEAVQAVFGGERLGSPGGARGWLDLTVGEAETKARELEVWVQEHAQGRGLMVACDEHTHYYRLQRAGWTHPLHVGVNEVAGARVLGIEWDQGDHSMRHRGERQFGQVYPVTVSRRKSGEAVLRWTIPPYDADLGCTVHNHS